jgi:hypothetical protein
MNFTKPTNTIDTLNIGQRPLITKWLDEHYIKNYIVNDDMTIDVNSDVFCANWFTFFDIYTLIEFPKYIKFGKIKGKFSCQGLNFVSLRGCPEEVTETFSCAENDLISLDHCPKKVGLSFVCHNNRVQFIKEDVLKRCVVGKKIYTEDVFTKSYQVKGIKPDVSIRSNWNC